MKVAVIGGGSTYTPELVDGIARLTQTSLVSELVLVDPDESRRAVVVGDTLIDRGNGLEFPTDWANKGVPPEEILAGLQPLLQLPVELVLPTHGTPGDRAVFERALA